MTILPLQLSKITVDINAKRYLGPIDLTIKAEGLIMIVGANGAGKSLLLRVCHGLVKPSSGEVKWQASRERSKRKQAFIFQRSQFLNRSALANVIYPLKLRGMARARRLKIAESVLEQVGLGALSERPAKVMSEGEKQKLALARGLAVNPEVLFLDEPSASLDPTATRDLEVILKKVAAMGVTIIMSSHDIGQIRRLAQRIIFIHNGKILEQGEAVKLLATPQTTKCKDYLDGNLVI